MTDLKRTIAGIAIHADTTDPAAAEKVKKILDAAMQSLTAEGMEQRVRRLEAEVEARKGRNIAAVLEKAGLGGILKPELRPSSTAS